MTRVPAKMKASLLSGWVYLAVLMAGHGHRGLAQEMAPAPVADVFAVMDEVHKLASLPLWPGFDIQKIPVAVFDGLNTYLFQTPSPPDGFLPVERQPRVFVYQGRHADVRSNSITRLADTWTATSVLSDYSRRTGEKYDLRDMAGIIVHEQFHVYQKTVHPDWRQNDGLLLVYPAETAESLFLRKLEKEAFKRAVIAENKNETSAWAGEALRYREQRLALLPEPFRLYEKELQRNEGLSDYIEKTARAAGPLNASDITNGIAPVGVRDLGYVEGRWIAMILDRLEPAWKPLLGKGNLAYLENILKAALGRSPADHDGFSKRQVRKIRDHSEIDFRNWQISKKQQLEVYFQESGLKVEIIASANPLRIRTFEPLAIETLPDRGVFHKEMFSAVGERGSLKVLGQSCITYLDDSLRVVRLVITGVRTAPQIDEKERTFKLASDKVTIELRFSRIACARDGFIVEL